jgi:hypothetical protein
MRRQRGSDQDYLNRCQKILDAFLPEPSPGIPRPSSASQCKHINSYSDSRSTAVSSSEEVARLSSDNALDDSSVSGVTLSYSSGVIRCVINNTSHK